MRREIKKTASICIDHVHDAFAVCLVFERQRERERKKMNVEITFIYKSIPLGFECQSGSLNCMILLTSESEPEQSIYTQTCAHFMTNHYYSFSSRFSYHALPDLFNTDNIRLCC